MLSDNLRNRQEKRKPDSEKTKERLWLTEKNNKKVALFRLVFSSLFAISLVFPLRSVLNRCTPRQPRRRPLRLNSRPRLVAQPNCPFSCPRSLDRLCVARVASGAPPRRIMAASSSPPAKFRPSAKFHAAHLDLPPSSPLMAHQDGEVSPSFASFDASFASSMYVVESFYSPCPCWTNTQPTLTQLHRSISADHRYEPSPLAQSRQPSSPHQMDISPAPVQPLQLSRPALAHVPNRLHAYGRAPPFEPLPTAGPSKYPFLQDFFQSSTAVGAPPPRIVRTRSPDPIIASPSRGAKMSRATTLPLPRRPAPTQPFNFAALLRPKQRDESSPQPTCNTDNTMDPSLPSSERNFSYVEQSSSRVPELMRCPFAQIYSRQVQHSSRRASATPRARC